MAKGLTSKQQAILEYILGYVRDNGYPPSIREIGKDFNIGSLRGVTVHLEALERKSYISRSNTPRSIKVVHPEYQVTSNVALLPIIGSIAAGIPIEAREEEDEHVPIPIAMVKNVQNAFLLRVKGDSMIGDGIVENDLVVVKPQVVATNNEIIAAMIDGEATVKRFVKDSKGVWLHASNERYAPINFQREDARIIGKIVGLVRDYTGMAF